MRVSRRYVNSSGAQLAAFNLPVHTNQTILMRMGQPYRVRALAGRRMEHAYSRAQPLLIGLLQSSFIHDDGLGKSADQTASPALCSDTSRKIWAAFRSCSSAKRRKGVNARQQLPPQSKKRCNISVAALCCFGVADGARTHDNRNHNPGLYQLSYSHRSFVL